MDIKKKIVILGTLNTKECEGYYLRDRIRKFGYETVLIDVSMKKYKSKLGKPDISNDQVAKSAKTTIDDVEATERTPAIEAMTKGATEIVKELYDAKKLDGIVGYGGGVGSTISISVLKSLPLGVPKLLVTTQPPFATQLIGPKDIIVFPSVTDMSGGLVVNRIEAIMLANAAAAISGMVEAKPVIPEEKPLIVGSQFGVTTPLVVKAKEILEEKGYELITFHATGIGGLAFEELVRSGLVTGVLDVTTHELVDMLVGGVCQAGPDRLTSAGSRGIPQVILPGALDMVNFWAGEIPEKFRNRHFYYHTSRVVLMRTSEEECAEVGKIVAEKVNHAKGPTAVVIPMRGWSAYDIEGGVFTLDYDAKPTNKSWYNPRADMAFVEALGRFVDRTKPNVEVIKVDLHINDPKFATLTVIILDDMIKGRWKKGKHYKTG